MLLVIANRADVAVNTFLSLHLGSVLSVKHVFVPLLLGLYYIKAHVSKDTLLKTK